MQFEKYRFAYSRKDELKQSMDGIVIGQTQKVSRLYCNL